MATIELQLCFPRLLLCKRCQIQLAVLGPKVDLSIVGVTYVSNPDRLDFICSSSELGVLCNKTLAERAAEAECTEPLNAAGEEQDSTSC